jgi:mannose/fructose-specific phosphotransferase system component IIA
MLGWVIAGHDDYAQKMLDAIEQRFGPQPQCSAVRLISGKD